jgi:hypothetical protein
MKTEVTTLFTPAVAPAHQTDSAKLVSLLALAGGVVAMPQIGSADIIYTNTSAVVVGYGGIELFDFSLPGTAVFRFQRSQTSSSALSNTLSLPIRYVIAGDLATGAPVGIRGNSVGFAVPLPLGATWSQGNVGDNTWNFVTVGTAYYNGRTPSSGYDHQYLAWAFEDSSQAGSPLRYGWVEVSLSIGNVTLNPASGPNVTIWGYAYDNSGLKPAMGQVPEPTSLSLLVLGALALGARGVRSWRRERAAAGKS